MEGVYDQFLKVCNGYVNVDIESVVDVEFDTLVDLWEFKLMTWMMYLYLIQL